MSPADGDLLALLAGVAAFLAAASVVGWVLHRRLAADAPNAVIDNLNARIKAWWVMVFLMALAFIGGRAGVTLLFALSSFAALREFLTIANAGRADHWALAAAFFVVLPVQYWLIWIGWYGLSSIFIPVYAFLFLPIIAAVRGDTARFLERVAAVQWGLMICVFCLSHVPALV
ncbi:MAG: phosphatidate cytidylyltransferase, partial [Rhizobiaceae bacterium]|nr:phosphatidate cytidylyltransferase [Rhizobiaceae bacterium]